MLMIKLFCVGGKEQLVAATCLLYALACAVWVFLACTRRAPMPSFVGLSRTWGWTHHGHVHVSVVRPVGGRA